MEPMTETYDRRAGLFAYPARGFRESVAETQTFLDERLPGGGAELRPFSDYAAGAAPDDLEELYTRTFDVQAITTLDLGYVLFGDDYKRGALLANLNREHREAGLDCGTELADHLPNVLRLLPRITDDRLRAEFVSRILAPGLARMIGEFEQGRIEAKTAVFRKHHKTLIARSEEHAIVYRYPLRAVYRALEHGFDLDDVQAPAQGAGFLESLRDEMRIEST